ncbi:hypothetical protein [Paenibacillus etheri]|uniref:hypothetical protein n=1 Tax=Paenibacillus etheri TaxID=1306852 RepID=UPI000A84D2F8|nr:hypothetical protein [Paenibacillus etheri]
MEWLRSILLVVSLSTSNLAISLVDVDFTKIRDIIDQSVLNSGDLVLLVDQIIF